MYVYERTSKLAISKNHAWSQLLEFWGSEVLAKIAAKINRYAPQIVLFINAC